MTVSAPKQATDDFARMTAPTKFGVNTVKSFEHKRIEDENAHLRSLVDKLSNKLKGQDADLAPVDDFLLKDQLSCHVLGPLIQNYESVIQSLERKLESSKQKFTQQMKDCEEVLLENTNLREQLEMHKREQLAALEKTFENPEPSNTEETMDLKRRAHVLSEENQVLFQQISFLRAQNDKQDEERNNKLEEATTKIRQFHFVQQEL